MMHCILLDDEPNALKALSMELSRHQDVIAIVAQFTDPRAALDYLHTHKVDVLFLDVEMPEISGLELNEAVRDLPVHVVFTTAHSKYALYAIKNSAVDYLLKPVDPDDLKECIHKLKTLFEHSTMEEKLINAIEKLDRLEAGPQKIKISVEGKVLFVNPGQILFCEAEGSYTRIHLLNGKPLLVSQRLKMVKEWLPAMYFLRVHHSFLVNIQLIKEFDRQESYLVMENDSVVPVARQRKNKLLGRV